MERVRAGPPWKGWSRRRKALVWTSGALAFLLLAAVVGGWLIWRQLNGNIRTVDAPLAPSDLSGTQNILIVGSDNRAGSDAKYGTSEGARSDTAILVHTPADRRDATVVSIPRDSMVLIPDCARSNGTVAAAGVGMFNSAFDTGGIACTVKTVEALTGIRITHFLVLDFTGFVKVVDALGGVRVCVTQPIEDTDSGLDLPVGTSTLNGERALAFVRVRHVGTGSDLDRIKRQQYFLSQVESQVRAAGLLTAPMRLYGVLNAATRAVVTDPALGSVSSLIGLVNSLNRIPSDRTAYVTVPNEPYAPDPNRVQWSQPAADQLWSALKDQPATAAASPGAEATAVPGPNAAESPVSLAGLLGKLAATSAASPSPTSFDTCAAG
jgi:LCP family protein required for cell wall assembly